MEVRFQPPAMAGPQVIPIRFYQLLVHPMPGRHRVGGVDRYDPTIEEARRAWAERSRYRGARLVGGVWVRSNQPVSVQLGFSHSAIPPPPNDALQPGRVLWRTDEWVFLTGVLRVKDLDLPEWTTVPFTRTENLDQFAIGFYIEIRLTGTAGPLVVHFGAPQVNLGPDLFPLGPAAATGELQGAMKLARGPTTTQRTEIAAGQRQGSSLIGIPARLEKVFIDGPKDASPQGGVAPGRGEAEPAPDTKPSHFQVELLGEKDRRPLCEFTVAPNGTTEMTRPLEEEVPLSPGDLVVTRLISGPTRAVEVYLQLVHSQVV